MGMVAPKSLHHKKPRKHLTQRRRMHRGPCSVGYSSHYHTSVSQVNLGVPPKYIKDSDLGLCCDWCFSKIDCEEAILFEKKASSLARNGVLLHVACAKAAGLIW